MKWLYKITNNINGKLYIGVSIDPERRWRQHKRKGTHCLALKGAMQKYGSDNFSFDLLLCGEDKYIDELEVAAIKLYNSKTPNGYNITLGGEGTLYYEWNDDWNIMLGTMKDRDLSKQLGIPHETIGSRRKALNIPTHLQNCKSIFEDNLSLLGVIPDKEMAAICGLSESWVQVQRTSRGKLKRERKTYSVTEDMKVFLMDTNLSQPEVTDKTGLPQSVIQRWRKVHGYTYKKHKRNPNFKPTEDFIEDVTNKVLTYKEISDKYDISVTKVASWKRELSVEHTVKPITEEIISEIKANCNIRELGKKHGIGEDRLYEIKRDLGINRNTVLDDLLQEPYYSKIIQWDSVCCELAEEWGVPPHRLPSIKREYQRNNRRLHPNNLTKEEWLYIRFLYEQGISYKGIILNLGLEVNRHDYIQQGLSGKRYQDVTGFYEGEVESHYGRNKKQREEIK